MTSPRLVLCNSHKEEQSLWLVLNSDADNAIAHTLRLLQEVAALAFFIYVYNIIIGCCKMMLYLYFFMLL